MIGLEGRRWCRRSVLALEAAGYVRQAPFQSEGEAVRLGGQFEVTKLGTRASQLAIRDEQAMRNRNKTQPRQRAANRLDAGRCEGACRGLGLRLVERGQI